jgi:hypothetical protein
MTLPGFTAEAGLHRSRMRYSAQSRGEGGAFVAAAPITVPIPIFASDGTLPPNLTQPSSTERSRTQSVLCTIAFANCHV